MVARVVIVGERQVRNRIRAMSRRAQNPEPGFRKVATYMRGTFAKQFTSRGNYLGTPWQPLSPRYARWKIQNGGGRRLLVFSGELRNSYTKKSASVYRVTGNTLEIGSANRLAAFHQYGTRSHRTGQQLIPARKVVVVNRMVREDVRALLEDYVVGRDRAAQGTVGGTFGTGRSGE